MNVQIVSTQTKPITTKSGQKMELRVVQGFGDDAVQFPTRPGSETVITRAARGHAPGGSFFVRG